MSETQKAPELSEVKVKRSSCELFLLMALLAVHAGADDGQDPRLSPAAEQAANAKIEKIKAELAQDAKPWWAGQYYEGGVGCSVSLTLAPDSGFVYLCSGCDGLIDRNYGPIQEVDGQIRLIPTLPYEADRSHLETKYIPVRWAKRKYLIPEGKMLEFCNKFNAGRLQLTSGNSYFLAETTTRETLALSLPEIPKELQKYLHVQAVICQIQEVRKPKVSLEKSWLEANKINRFNSTPVSLNKGQDDGIFVGMKLYCVNPHDDASDITVTSVDKNSSEAVIRENVTKSRTPTVTPLVGWKVSTSPWPSNE
ncbi:hypothetical protein [Planctomicrobium piriforme]|uniref:hypothetical protein n=1 Tax=Planctomicrobium piriforme TaxID=1576369 RepID=UPI001113F73D|nr:hypothetical protein [Planctomicrobium piriforme]